MGDWRAGVGSCWGTKTNPFLRDFATGRPRSNSTVEDLPTKYGGYIYLGRLPC